MGMSPEQARMAHEMMKGMDEDTLKSMMEMSASFNKPAGAVSGDASADMASMKAQASKMMQNPEMMKSVGKMMKTMDPAMLENMTKQVCFEE